MSVDKEVFYLFLLGTLLTTLSPITAEKICPSKCNCSTDFTAIKCRGLDKFPVLEFAVDVRTLDLSRSYITDIEKTDLKAYGNLQYLDLRYNEIKSVSPGLFSEVTTLRELYIGYNPWSCDNSTLYVLQLELTALTDKNSHLENFDGGSMECFDPPDMKGRQPLHSVYPTTKVSNEPKKVKGAEVDKQQIASGLIVLLIFLAVLMSVVTCGAAWVFRETLLHWIKNVWRPKSASDPVSNMEAGESESKTKKYHKSQAPSASDRRKTTSLDNKLDNKDSLIDCMKKRRRMSQGLPASHNSSASSLEEIDGGKVNQADKHETQDQLDSNRSILTDSMKRRRRMSQGIPASHNSSASSLEEIDGGKVNQADIQETQDQLDSNRSILIDSMKRRRRMSQGIPASLNSSAPNSDNDEMEDPADYLKKEMQKQRRHSCGFAEGENSSDDESGLTQQ